MAAMLAFVYKIAWMTLSQVKIEMNYRAIRALNNNVKRNRPLSVVRVGVLCKG